MGVPKANDSGGGTSRETRNDFALVALLAVLTVAAPASAAEQGGAFTGMFATDVDYIDPSLAY